MTPGNASSMGNEKTRKISVDYTVSAMKCLLTQAGSDQKGRFVYCSGALAERDQTKSLWFSSDFRKVRVGGTTISKLAMTIYKILI